jgi:antitoxin YefM
MYTLYVLYILCILEVKGEMIMQAVLNSTEARKNWSELIDDIAHNKPQFISRNNRDPFLSINMNQTKVILSKYTFNFEYEFEEDDTVTAGLEGFDLFVNAETKEQAIRELAVDLIEYAKEYFDNIQLYFNAPNRQDHFPFIMNVLLQEDLDGVINNLIHAD